MKLIHNDKLENSSVDFTLRVVGVCDEVVFTERQFTDGKRGPVEGPDLISDLEAHGWKKA